MIETIPESTGEMNHERTTNNKASHLMVETKFYSKAPCTQTLADAYIKNSESLSPPYADVKR